VASGQEKRHSIRFEESVRAETREVSLIFLRQSPSLFWFPFLEACLPFVHVGFARRQQSLQNCQHFPTLLEVFFERISVHFSGFQAALEIALGFSLDSDVDSCFGLRTKVPRHIPRNSGTCVVSVSLQPGKLSSSYFEHNSRAFNRAKQGLKRIAAAGTAYDQLSKPFHRERTLPVTFRVSTGRSN
jgi:hypothetical protein